MDIRIMQSCIHQQQASVLPYGWCSKHGVQGVTSGTCSPWRCALLDCFPLFRRRECDEATTYSQSLSYAMCSVIYLAGNTAQSYAGSKVAEVSCHTIRSALVLDLRCLLQNNSFIFIATTCESKTESKHVSFAAHFYASRARHTVFWSRAQAVHCCCWSPKLVTVLFSLLN